MQSALTAADRRKFRSKAQLLEPVLKVGRNGITESFTASVLAELAMHELIKIKFVDFKEEKEELAVQLAEATQSQLVQIVGHVAVFYKAKPQGMA